jgi:hypothetical protein
MFMKTEHVSHELENYDTRSKNQLFENKGVIITQHRLGNMTKKAW